MGWRSANANDTQSASAKYVTRLSRAHSQGRAPAPVQGQRRCDQTAATMHNGDGGIVVFGVLACGDNIT